MSLTATTSVNFPARVWRWTMLVHRWLGVALGVLVFAWCSSGIVMMYVPYPALDESEWLSVLDQVDTADLDAAPRLAPGLANLAADSLVLERWGSRGMLRTTLSSGEAVMIDLATGAELTELAEDELRSVGLSMGDRLGLQGGHFLGHVDTDQWTVHGRFNRHRPMLLFQSDDETRWYVSGQTGELVQLTEASERFWNWLGSVVHWLYPTMLRKNTALWAQVVIWLTIVALFLTITGVAFGLKQYRFSKHQRSTPYQGFSKWHHYSGLLFGLFTLTWLISGLVSMNPWGALEGRSFAQERERLLGESVALGQLMQAMKTGVEDGTGAVRVLARRSAFGVQVFAIDKEGTTKALPGTEAAHDGRVLASIARPEVGVSTLDILESGDAYYYDHHKSKHFPVFRAIYDDGEQHYFSPVTGEILLSVDTERAWYRWLFNALHTGDFHQLARMRPVWDVWMIILIAGLIAGSGTGVVLAWRRVFRAKPGLRNP